MFFHPNSLFVLGVRLDPCPEAFTLENLDGEWFVPGNVIGGTSVTDPFWKNVKAGVNKNPDVKTLMFS